MWLECSKRDKNFECFVYERLFEYSNLCPSTIIHVHACTGAFTVVFIEVMYSKKTPKTISSQFRRHLSNLVLYSIWLYFITFSLRLVLVSRMMILISTTRISRNASYQFLSRTIVGLSQSLLITGSTAVSYRSGRSRQLTSPSLLSILLLLE